MSAYMTDEDFDVEEQIAVLRLLASRSPVVSAEAAKSFCATAGAARQVRIDRLVPAALADADAEWNFDERQRLVAAMGMPSSSGEVWSPPRRRDHQEHSQR